MRRSFSARLRALSSAVKPVLIAVSAGLIASACASSHASYDSPSNIGAQNQAQVAISLPEKVDLEDDGLAVQAPPRIRKYQEPDDPSEPFSPNYGPAPKANEPAQKEPAAPQRAAQKRQLEYRSRTTPMSPSEANAIIVQAMIAHERRNP